MKDPCDGHLENELIMKDLLLDESQMRGTVICRACKKLKYDILTDNGYCGDCD